MRSSTPQRLFTTSWLMRVSSVDFGSRSSIRRGPAPIWRAIGMHRSTGLLTILRTHLSLQNFFESTIVCITLRMSPFSCRKARAIRSTYSGSGSE